MDVQTTTQAYDGPRPIAEGAAPATVLGRKIPVGCRFPAGPFDEGVGPEA